MSRPPPPPALHEVRESAEARTAGQARAGQWWPVLPEPGLPLHSFISYRGDGVAVPSLGGVVYDRGWGQRKSLAEGKGTEDLHLRGKGKSCPPSPRPEVSPQTLG